MSPSKTWTSSSPLGHDPPEHCVTQLDHSILQNNLWKSKTWLKKIIVQNPMVQELVSLFLSVWILRCWSFAPNCVSPDWRDHYIRMSLHLVNNYHSVFLTDLQILSLPACDGVSLFLGWSPLCLHLLHDSVACCFWK